MLVKHICPDCIWSSKKRIDINDANLLDESSFIDSSINLCQKCKLLIKTVYLEESDPKRIFTEKDLVTLPKQSLFFHLNKKVLYNESPANDYTKKNVLIVGCGGIHRQKLIKNLKSLSFNRLVCLENRNTWAFGYFDGWISADSERITEEENSLQAVKDYMRINDIKFDAIITYDDYSVAMTSYLTTNLDLPGIPYELICQIKDKHAFRKLCLDLKIASPNFFVIKSFARSSYLNQFNYLNKSIITSLLDENECKLPVIVKNSYGSGKDFIRKCNRIDEFIKSIEDSMAIENLDLLVEEFIEGHEIDIDMLIKNNKVVFMAISDNFPPMKPYFFEQGCVAPSLRLSMNEQQHIKNLIQDWVRKLNFGNACLHFEAICKNGSDLSQNDYLMPIEINARLAGSEAWSMIKTGFNVDLLREHVNISLGYDVDEAQLEFKATNPRYQCISLDFRQIENVYFKSLRIKLSELKRNPDAVEIQIIRSPNEQIIKEIIGWITVKSEPNCSLSHLQTKLGNIIKNLEFQFVK